MIEVAAFYKFVPLPQFRELREPLTALGKRLTLKGTILLAPEGLNATIAGSLDSIESFMAGAGEPFTELDIKYSTCESLPFRRWRVRLKKEIVTLKRKVDPSARVGRYVDAAAWNELIATPEVAVIDVRNKYEIEYGSFKGATNPETEDFWEFPSFAEQHLTNKEQPIAMFCTGGIRCEKATSYLLEQGYKNVMHLRGGILKYLEKVPQEESLFEGSCFVFDDREALDHELKPVRK